MPLHIQHLSRRAFLRNTALAGAATATAAFSARSWAQVAGANSDVRVAVVGLNGRGRSHLASLAKVPGVRLVAICDVDTAVLEKTKAGLGAAGASVRTFVDLRELLAMPGLDAITIATPNHLHSLQGIWAAQAGKDVYVEKPVSHNVWEGRQLVAAAAKYNRVIQCGTQIRSGAGLREAVAWVRAGNLGKITASRGFCYKRRDSIGRTSGPQKIPDTVNYDLWSGPAPTAELRRARLHYDWHWDYLTGNGDVGNQGIHQMDVARWFLGEPGLPRGTLSIGGRLGYVDDGNTPNTQVVIHDYASAPLIFEVRGLPSKAEAAVAAAVGDQAGADAANAAVAKGAKGRKAGGRPASAMDNYRGVAVGNVVECEGGSVVTTEYFSATAYDNAGKVLKEFKGSDRHMQNFIDVVRSRKIADQYGPILEGHVSSALCHLGNISHVLGRGLAPDVLREKIRSRPALAEATARMAEHLAANKVDLAKTPLTYGVPLTIAPGKEAFTGEFAKEATPLLTRKYRAPYIVPDLTGKGASSS
ncbi:MAG: Gfo/Idh/MocA family oxidoreductase [Opitutaceae bacterium]|nr:Gfo/Idh/MocA family oxidoreductase [Opitutaceae bacterium]